MEQQTALAALIAIATVHFIALVSPGPDFFLILRNSMRQTRAIGILSAIGLGLGVFFHTTYSLFGISYLFQHYPHLMEGVAIIGASYLCYLGITGLRHLSLQKHEIKIDASPAQREITAFQAIRSGFFTNVLNPKAYAYFLSFFSGVAAKFPQKWFVVAASFEVVILTVLWFSLVAMLSTTNKMQQWLGEYQGYVDMVASVMFICFGLGMLSFGLSGVFAA